MELLSWKRYDDKYKLSQILTEAARSCVDAHTARPEEYLAAYFTEKCSGDEIRGIVTRAVYLPSGTVVLRLTLQLLNGMETESAAFVQPSHGEYDAGADETTDPTTYTTEALQKSYFPRLLQFGARDQKGFDTTLRQISSSAEAVDVGVSVMYGLSTVVASAAARCSSIPLFMYLRQLFPSLGGDEAFTMPQLCISFFGPGNPSTARLALKDVLLIPAMPEGCIPNEIIQKIFAAFHHFCRAHNTMMRSDGSLAYDDFENVTDALGLAEEAVRAVGLTPVKDICIGLRFAAAVTSPSLAATAVPSAAAWKESKDTTEVMYALFPGDADVSGAQVSEYLREQLQNCTDFVVYVEDTHCDRDTFGLQRLQAHLGDLLHVSGRDIYARSQYKKVEHGIRGLWTSNFVLDPGAIGTLSDVHEIVRRVKEFEGRCVSFVTQELVGNAATMAHLSVAMEARFLCMGGLLSTPQCEVLSHLISIQSELLHSRALSREAPKIARMELPKPPTDVVPEIKRRMDKKKRKK
ncbi:enolase [Trypanosoma cruzi Dm28c]|uniref:phosphopyruvate hydratase n=2 Tax=Trypanosoma cruzi TaxID=5693 RepID=V5DME2_TRYCR|nr:enolase [Trypanosoma cruzi Dm28c]PBJ80232.1 enolase [Trypanosoma cruzi cruzi]PWU96024.1 putative enolase [Trypanosoma cruzi]